MRRLIILLMLALVSVGYGQRKKISELPADTSVTSSMLFLIVQDSSGTNVNRKLTGANLYNIPDINVGIFTDPVSGTSLKVASEPDHSYAIYGENSADGAGIGGVSNSGTGVYGVSTTGYSGYFNAGGTYGLVSLGGNVGIGTVTPYSKLYVLSTTDPQVIITHTAGADSLKIYVDGSGDATITASGGDIGINVAPTAGIALKVQNAVDYAIYGNNTDAGVGVGGVSGTGTGIYGVSTSGYSGYFNSGGTVGLVSLAGNTGLGTVSPDAALHILNTTSPQFVITDTHGADSLTVGVDGNGDVAFIASGTDYTFTGGIKITEVTGVAQTLILEADASEDNADTWQLIVADGDELAIQAFAGGSYADALTIVGSTLASDFPGALTAATFVSDGKVAGATYGSDASISDAELLTLDDGALTEILVGGGAGSAPVWTTVTGTGAPVRATSPTLVTPALGAATATSIVASSNYLVEGYATGRNVIRSIRLTITPGGTPGTDISVDDISSAVYTFNAPSITDVTNLEKSETDGQWTLNAGGTTITLNLTEAVVGILSAGFAIQDLNSSTAPTYFPSVIITGANLVVSFSLEGSSAAVDLTTILDAGDTCDLLISFVTSS